MDFLVYPKEKVYFVISLVFSIILYLLLLISIIGLFYILIGALIGLILQGLLIGNLRGNGVRVSEDQFPEVYRIASDLAQKMQMDLPAIYIIQAGGMLNAFATKFLGRSFVVIYSDIIELAYEEGEQELAFILAHELAHLKRKHLTYRMLLYPSMIIPFLAPAYSRACEYTCDRFGAYYQPKGSAKGLLILSAGKKLYQRMNIDRFGRQALEENGFWVSFTEILGTHPNLPKRVNAVRSFLMNNNYQAEMSQSVTS